MPSATFSAGFEVHVEDGHAGAFGGEALAGRAADAAAAAGDDHGLALEIAHDVSFFGVGGYRWRCNSLAYYVNMLRIIGLKPTSASRSSSGNHHGKPETALEIREIELANRLFFRLLSMRQYVA